MIIIGSNVFCGTKEANRVKEVLEKAGAVFEESPGNKERVKEWAKLLEEDNDSHQGLWEQIQQVNSVTIPPFIKSDRDDTKRS